MCSTRRVSRSVELRNISPRNWSCRRDTTRALTIGPWVALSTSFSSAERLSRTTTSLRSSERSFTRIDVSCSLPASIPRQPTLSGGFSAPTRPSGSGICWGESRTFGTTLGLPSRASTGRTWHRSRSWHPMCPRFRILWTRPTSTRSRKTTSCNDTQATRIYSPSFSAFECIRYVCSVSLHLWASFMLELDLVGSTWSALLEC
mmetsp:Transcript_6685/g.25784  ORF Transcript_6685/g.25784 Transcript_6685/m.25784 type:complete len:203 (-) Transcript_6685:666-1274(-)